MGHQAYLGRGVRERFVTVNFSTLCVQAYSTEIFYGQGIHTTSPGMSHVRLFALAILGLCSYLC